ncbi:hypothetical protein [Sphingobacterium tabacisoli]|uniref:Uncharacterized protein n=1 Tax=Sphingobacterium tabacisoli TaxID=2044855 RepID=A0ABW5L4Q8_9SPHI|nr:hypothetical protein [Sphingobacterium tabacisoli]
MRPTINKEQWLLIQLFIGIAALMIGLFLFITHYNQETGRFLIKTGLIYETVILLRLISHHGIFKRKPRPY